LSGRQRARRAFDTDAELALVEEDRGVASLGPIFESTAA